MCIEVSKHEALEIIVALKEKSFLLSQNDKRGQSDAAMELAHKIGEQLYGV